MIWERTYVFCGRTSCFRLRPGTCLTDMLSSEHRTRKPYSLEACRHVCIAALILNEHNYIATEEWTHPPKCFLTSFEKMTWPWTWFPVSLLPLRSTWSSTPKRRRRGKSGVKSCSDRTNEQDSLELDHLIWNGFLAQHGILSWTLSSYITVV